MRRPSATAIAQIFIAATLLLAAPAPPAQANPEGPVISFGGRRFAVTRGAEAFESIAFDPVNRRIASAGEIRNQCGDLVAPGPSEAPGLAWDPLSNSYWQITNDRRVRRWVGPQVVQEVFTIPQVFDVPGTGPDTLEAPKGIAVDPDFVYVVDAGSDPGQIGSNEWFKFTRTGTPVKSSKATGLRSHLVANPDCLFDDILYVPPGTPVYPGRLLIPLEHSGLIVIDTEGNYVDALYWEDDPLYSRCAPFAFTGMAVESSTGTFYLAENDGRSSQVWTMIPEGGPLASYIVGTGFDQAYLQSPVPGCNLPLWRRLVAPGQTEPGIMFGLAYRPVDGMVYGFDFNAGSLWKFNPIEGRASLAHDMAIPAVWGLAYDPQFDLLYASRETGDGNHIIMVDPQNGGFTPLPNLVGFYVYDLAFCPDDRQLYSVAGTQLIRISPVSGRGTFVGNTVPARGLTWDPATERLIGITTGTPQLYSIDPATGDATLLADLPKDRGWEGLALVTLPAPTSDAPGEPPLRLFPGIAAAPNPASSVLRLQADLPAAGRAQIEAFDTAGRLVRSVYAGPVRAGTSDWSWDGRDDSGRPVPNGTYWIRLQAGAETRVAKIVWVR